MSNAHRTGPERSQCTVQQGSLLGAVTEALQVKKGKTTQAECREGSITIMMIILMEVSF